MQVLHCTQQLVEHVDLAAAAAAQWFEGATVASVVRSASSVHHAAGQVQRYFPKLCFHSRIQFRHT
jgi:hypothetical protein